MCIRDRYEADTDRIDIHVQNARQDIPVFTRITEDGLLEKVRQIFFYSLHNETISRFRRMMTLEQFRSPELAALYSRRYVERVTEYHAGIFRSLIAAGELRDCLLYTSGEMRRAELDSPVLHGIGDDVGRGQIEALALVDGGVDIFKNSLRKLLLHHGFAEHMAAKEIRYSCLLYTSIPGPSGWGWGYRPAAAAPDRAIRRRDSARRSGA